jgi:hypothetical protein
MASRMVTSYGPQTTQVNEEPPLEPILNLTLTQHVVTLLWPSVRMKLTLPKLGTWSPPGLSKTQSLISGVKTPCIGLFLILLKRSQSVDVQNDLACVIWTSVAQVMGKRRAGSQTGSLTPDH